MALVRPIFVLGARYRVKKSFMSGASTFIRDEILTFKHEGYSRYDDCFVYTFHSELDGQQKGWWLGYDEEASSYDQFFERATQ